LQVPYNTWDYIIDPTIKIKHPTMGGKEPRGTGPKRFGGKEPRTLNAAKSSSESESSEDEENQDQPESSEDEENQDQPETGFTSAAFLAADIQKMCTKVGLKRRWYTTMKEPDYEPFLQQVSHTRTCHHGLPSSLHQVLIYTEKYIYISIVVHLCI